MALRRASTIAALLIATTTLLVGGLGCDKLMKAAKKSQKHAAIAYDEKTGGWGYSYDHITEDAAKKASTEKCPHCTVRLSWNQGCGALAQSESKKEVMTTGLGTNKPAAEGAAKAECVKQGGGTCKILVYACNSTN